VRLFGGMGRSLIGFSRRAVICVAKSITVRWIFSTICLFALLVRDESEDKKKAAVFTCSPFFWNGARTLNFCDEKNYTANQKLRIYKKFLKVVKERDSMLIDKGLYDFLYLNCGFIAHYNRFGFCEFYGKKLGMAELLDELLHHHFHWGCAVYMDIGTALQDLAREELLKVLREVEAEKERSKVLLVRQLAEKHGLKIEEYRERVPELNFNTLELPFDTSKKMKSTFHDDQLLLVL
jgi:hypothetical protein